MDNEGYYEEFIDADDEKLKYLKNEYGQEVFTAVTIALTEFNDFISSDRCTIPELWNFRDKRKATMKEGVLHLLKQLKGQWLREKEKLHRKIAELGMNVDSKQTAVHGMEQNMGGNNYDELEQTLKEKEQALSEMEDLNQALTVKERKSNDELQDAHKELISSFKEGGTRSIIRVKRMGELDNKPFHTAMKRKFSGAEAEEKASELCSLWEGYLRDSSWHPFKIIMDKTGNRKEIIDGEDVKLKNLKSIVRTLKNLLKL